MSSTTLSSSDSGEGIFLHPDALPCLKRSQLQSLCGRLGLKATGKNSELIERLVAFANETNSAEGPTQGRFVVLRPTKPSSSPEDDDPTLNDGSLTASSSLSSSLDTSSSLTNTTVTRSRTRRSMRTMRSTRSRAKMLADETTEDESMDASLSVSASLAAIDTEIIEQPVRRSGRSRKTMAQLDAAPQPAISQEHRLKGEDAGEENAQDLAHEEMERGEVTGSPEAPGTTPKGKRRSDGLESTPQPKIAAPRGAEVNRVMSSVSLSTIASTPKLSASAHLSSTPRAHAAPRASQTPRGIASPRTIASPRPLVSSRSIASPRLSSTPRVGQSASARRLTTPRQSSTPARARLANRTPLQPSPASHLADGEPWEHVGGEARGPAATLGHTDYHLEATQEEEQTDPTSPPPRPAMTRDHTMTLSEFGIDGAPGSSSSGSDASLKSRSALSGMSKSGSLRSLSSSVHDLGRGLIDKVGEVAKRAGGGAKRKRDDEQDGDESRAHNSVLISTNDDGDISMHTTCDDGDEAPALPLVEVPRPIRGRPSRAGPSRALLSPEPASSIYPALPEPMAASVYPKLPSPVSSALAASPVSPPTVSSQGFSEAANRVLAEMNARLEAAGRGPMVQLPSANAWSVSGPHAANQGSIRTRMAEGPATRFDGTHAKHFGQMDSIMNHYAAKRATPASASSNTTAAPSTKRVKVDAEAKAADAQPSSDPAVAIKTAKEQEIIRRKLQVARARRRSLGGPKSQAAAARKSSGLAQRVGGRIAQAVGKAVDGVRRAMPSGAAAPAMETAPGPAQKGHKKKPSFDLKASLANKPSWATRQASSKVSTAASSTTSLAFKTSEAAAPPVHNRSSTSSMLSPPIKPAGDCPISHPMRLGSRKMALPARSSSKITSPVAATSAHERQLAKKRVVMGLSPRMAGPSQPMASRNMTSPTSVTGPSTTATTSTALRSLASPPQPAPSSASVSSARKVRSSMGSSARGSASLMAGSTIASRKRAEIIRASREAQAQARTNGAVLSPSSTSTMRASGQLRRKPANASLAATAAAQARPKGWSNDDPSTRAEAPRKPESPSRRAALQGSRTRKLGAAGRGKGGLLATAGAQQQGEGEENNAPRDEDATAPHDSASFEDLTSTILFAVS